VPQIFGHPAFLPDLTPWPPSLAGKEKIWRSSPLFALERTAGEVNPKTLVNPKPTGVGKWGSRERSPLARDMGVSPPTNSKWERVARISNPATSGTQNPGKP